MMTSSEEEAAPLHGGHEQPPSAINDSAKQSTFLPRGFYGASAQEQWHCYGDLTAQYELDQFGFLRAEGGMGSFFPTASEIERMGEAQMNEDEDMKGIFEF